MVVQRLRKFRDNISLQFFGDHNLVCILEGLLSVVHNVQFYVSFLLQGLVS